MENIDGISLLVGALTGAIAVGIVYFFLEARDMVRALKEALTLFSANTPALDLIEGQIETLPESAQAILAALAGWVEAYAQTTESEIDDIIAEIFGKLTDGQPNMPSQ